MARRKATTHVAPSQRCRLKTTTRVAPCLNTRSEAANTPTLSAEQEFCLNKLAPTLRGGPHATHAPTPKGRKALPMPLCGRRHGEIGGQPSQICERAAASAPPLLTGRGRRRQTALLPLRSSLWDDGVREERRPATWAEATWCAACTGANFVTAPRPPSILIRAPPSQ